MWIPVDLSPRRARPTKAGLAALNAADHVLHPFWLQYCSAAQEQVYARWHAHRYWQVSIKLDWCIRCLLVNLCTKP